MIKNSVPELFNFKKLACIYWHTSVMQSSSLAMFSRWSLGRKGKEKGASGCCQHTSDNFNLNHAANRLHHVVCLVNKTKWAKNRSLWHSIRQGMWNWWASIYTNWLSSVCNVWAHPLRSTATNHKQFFQSPQTQLSTVSDTADKSRSTSITHVFMSMDSKM